MVRAIVAAPTDPFGNLSLCTVTSVWDPADENILHYLDMSLRGVRTRSRSVPVESFFDTEKCAKLAFRLGRRRLVTNVSLNLLNGGGD